MLVDTGAQALGWQVVADKKDRRAGEWVSINTSSHSCGLGQDRLIASMGEKTAISALT